MDKIESVGAKTRKNSVLAQEIFLSASPEYFRPQAPGQAGEWDTEKMEAWTTAAKEWLFETFKDRMVDCRLHLDESTPHIHAVVIPLTADNRLSAREIFSKKTLRDMQTSYAAATENLGLHRGIAGSKAKHISVKKFYSAVNRQKTTMMPKISTPNSMILEKTRIEYADKINSILSKKLKPIISAANSAILANRKKNEYQKTAASLATKNFQLREQLRTANDQARETPLELILEKAGLDRDPKDRGQWLGAGHRITVKGQKWYDHKHGKGGGGAIDLAMHLRDCDFKEAISWIGQRINVDEAARAIKDNARIQAEACKDLDISFRPPTPAPKLIPALKKYLAERRGLDPKLTDPLIDKGLIYAELKYNKHPNAVFLCQNNKGLTGAEVKGMEAPFYGTFYGTAKGSDRKGGAFMIGIENHGKKAVFVESAIDAIAYKQLHPEPCLVISTAGATTPPAFIENELIPQGFEIVFAYDNDREGQVFLPKWQDAVPGLAVEIPEKKDWNDDLIQKRNHAAALFNAVKLSAPIFKPGESVMQKGASGSAGKTDYQILVDKWESETKSMIARSDSGGMRRR
jgi:hypothetical protein